VRVARATRPGATGPGNHCGEDSRRRRDRFCAGATGIDRRVDTAPTDLEGDGPSVASAFRQPATEFRGIERPPPHQHPFRWSRADGAPVVREQHGHGPDRTGRAAQQEDPGALQALTDRLHGASGRGEEFP
jgi:hypothetical protein